MNLKKTEKITNLGDDFKIRLDSLNISDRQHNQNLPYTRG